MQIGSHVSIRKGYLAAAQTAVSIGADACQFFTKNPRSLSVKQPDMHDAARCKAFVQEHHLSAVVHSPYPVNLAADDDALREAIVQTVVNDLEIADACGAVGVIVHFGHYKGPDPLQGYKNILQCIENILQRFAGEALLLIENQAGGAPPMGTTWDELAQIRELSSQPERIGFCFDTCHAFASGLLSRVPVHSLLDDARVNDYFNHVKAIHLNDSAYPAGSGKDRHAPLGQGWMGEWLREFIQQVRHLPIPAVLETPDKNLHPQEISMVRQWLSADENEASLFP